MKDIKFDFDDIMITPEVLSDVSSRSECRPKYNRLVRHDNSKLFYLEHGSFPLIASPMYDVVTANNYKRFDLFGINPILPRGIIPNIFKENPPTSEGQFNFSVSLKDLTESDTIHYRIKGYYLNSMNHSNMMTILIDNANGHMQLLYDTAKKFIEWTKTFKNGGIRLIVGNVSNPETYRKYAEIGVHGVRLGIGNGSACTTSANVAIGYPMASLIKECADIKDENNFETYIIADGGFRSFSDIIKALNLGADYVMLGGMLNSLQDTLGVGYLFNTIKVSGTFKEVCHALKLPVYHEYRGMSTKIIQSFENKTKKVTSEGIVKRNKTTIPLLTWLENFEDYLKSAMSYSGVKDLERFIGKQNFNHITTNAYRRFAK